VFFIYIHHQYIRLYIKSQCVRPVDGECLLKLNELQVDWFRIDKDFRDARVVGRRGVLK